MTYPTTGDRVLGNNGAIGVGTGLSSAACNGEPAGAIAYAQIVTNTAAFGAGVHAITDGTTTLGVGVTPLSNRFYRLTAQAAFFTLAGGGNVTVDFGLYDATALTYISSVTVANSITASSTVPGASVVGYYQASTGGATFYAVVQIVVNSGSATCVVGATPATNAARSAFLLVEDMSSAF